MIAALSPTDTKIAGFGFRRGVTLASLRRLLASTDQAQDLSALATAADKALTPAFQDLARSLGVPVIAVSLADICEQEEAVAGPHVPARYGHKSLSEAAALAACGANAALILRRTASADGLATIAIAQIHAGYSLRIEGL